MAIFQERRWADEAPDAFALILRWLCSHFQTDPRMQRLLISAYLNAERVHASDLRRMVERTLHRLFPAFNAEDRSSARNVIRSELPVFVAMDHARAPRNVFLDITFLLFLIWRIIAHAVINPGMQIQLLILPLIIILGLAHRAQAPTADPCSDQVITIELPDNTGSNSSPGCACSENPRHVQLQPRAGLRECPDPAETDQEKECEECSPSQPQLFTEHEIIGFFAVFGITVAFMDPETEPWANDPIDGPVLENNEELSVSYALSQADAYDDDDPRQ
jgi:hypothetical protein